MSLSAENRYINKRSDMVKENKLLADAEILPKRIRKWKNFKEAFGNINQYEFNFLDLKIVIDIRYAYNYFTIPRTPMLKTETISQEQSYLSYVIHSSSSKDMIQRRASIS